MKLSLEATNLLEVRKNKKLHRQLCSLTLRGESSMRDQMHTVSDEYAKKHIIIFARQPNGKLVGWSMVFKLFYTIDKNYYCWFYVNRSFRRKGVGTALLKMAEEIVYDIGGAVLVDAHDKTSAGFFRSLGY